MQGPYLDRTRYVPAPAPIYLAITGMVVHATALKRRPSTPIWPLVVVWNSIVPRRPAVRTITTLAAGDAPSDNLRLVFDRIGDRRFLSEVWFPKSDGLLVHGTPQEHKHDVLKSGQ